MKLYVDQAAAMNGSGSKEAPFKYINAAAKIAQPGDEVIVAPGIYREYIDPINSGEENNRIAYRSEEPLGAVITGAETLNDWKLYKGTTWAARVNDNIFGDYNPYRQLIEGDWCMSPVLHTGDIYLNDRSMYECSTLEDCVKGNKKPLSWEIENSVYQWYCEHSGDETVIYANFQDKNPNTEKVEFSVRRRCVFPTQEMRNYITFRGFLITKAATTWAPPSCHQDGMIGVNWSKGWIIEDCEISNSKCCGISLGRNYDPDNEQFFFYHQVKSPNQMGRESICRALSQGWFKEQTGSHIVRGCNIHHCEQAGIIGRQGCVFSTIENNHIHHINVMQQIMGAEVAGIKLHVPIDVTLSHNHIHHCVMGIWCDWVAQGTRISRNLLHDNQGPEGQLSDCSGFIGQDIFIEASLGPTLIDNNVLLSDISIRMASQGIALVHNLICGSFTSVGGGSDQNVDGVNQPRYFSYHYPHRTELMGFMSCLHGDNRIYNNIFIQKKPCQKEMENNEEMGFFMKNNRQVGTSVWDDYPTYEKWINEFDFTKKPDMKDMKMLSKIHFAHLPVWIEGNAYFNGALGCRNEDNKQTGIDEVELVLKEKEGQYYLETNLAEQIGEFTCDMINSDLLGAAFEPNERFENVDGSDIIFNADYFNHLRKKVIPGPFAKVDKSIALT